MEKVIFNHDAAIDEYMAAVLLTTIDTVETAGFVITNADCIDAPAMQANWAIQSFIDRKDIPLTLSKARGWNPFPWQYRGDCIKELALPIFNDYGPHRNWPPFPDGDVWLKRALQKADDNSITMLVNCPMTTLANILDARNGKRLMKKINRLIWMGGAVDVPGNLDPATLPPGVANPYAEWNAYWDPSAVDWIFKNTDFPIIIFPLDITNQAAITPAFMNTLFTQSMDYRYSELAYQSYNIVAQESFYDMWDVVTTCYIPHPEFFATPDSMQLTILVEGPNQGALRRCTNGREVQVVQQFAENGQQQFYDYVAEQFRRN